MRRSLTASILAAALACGTAAAQAPPPAGGISQRLSAFGADTGKLNGQIDQSRRTLDQLRAQRAALEADFRNTVAAIEQRLAPGTTPANPELVGWWQHAQATLTSLDQGLVQLSAVSARLSETAALADYLGNSVQAAYALSGTTDADHQQLVDLENNAKNAAAAVKQLAEAVGHDMDEQAAALDTEHRNLVTLRHAVDIGTALGNNLSRVGAGQ